MKKNTMILGTNEEGFKESGKFLAKFLIFCFILAVCFTIGSYTSYFLGFVIFCFIFGIRFFIKKRLRAKRSKMYLK